MREQEHVPGSCSEHLHRKLPGQDQKHVQNRRAPRGANPAERQSGVDALLEQIRTGGPDRTVSANAHPTTTSVQAANIISELIRALDHEFAGDPSLVSNHASALQAFDLAVQALDAMVLSAEGDNSRRLADALAACRHLVGTISAGSAPAIRPTIEPN